MLLYPSRRARISCAALAVLTFASACENQAFAPNFVTPVPIVVVTRFVVTRLVSDAIGANATFVDPLLINPWGLAFGPTGLLWAANNGSSTATVYDVNGVKQSLVVTIPSATGAANGNPTGQVFNSTTSFTIPGRGTAQFIFAGEDGTIAAWNSSLGTAAALVADRSATGAVYKGIAIASSNGANFLYLTNFRNNSIDVFDTNFQFVRSFNDGTIPTGFAPFGIQNINGTLFVSYAKQLPPDNHDDQAGVGNGFVDVFNPDGSLVQRLASNGTLNSPWGMAIAPPTFGDIAGALLVGNFGDGRINAYNLATGAFLGQLADQNGAAITLPGLWSLTVGPGLSSNTVFFSSGPGNEMHGLLGTITRQ